MSDEFLLKVSKGEIKGYSVIDKFGFNPVITTGTDPEDVWEGGGRYNYDDNETAPIISLISNNINDTEPIKILGLDINGVEIEQTITLNGTTRVELTTPLWRVYRMENDGTSDIEGTVFCYTGTNSAPSIGDDNIRAIINGDNNQTLMAVYTVPKGKTAYLFRGEFGMEFTGSPGAGTNFAVCHYESRRYGKVFKTKKKITLINLGNSNYKDKRSFPDPIPELTDIRLVVDEVSDDMGVWGTFDILLEDNY